MNSPPSQKGTVGAMVLVYTASDTMKATAMPIMDTTRYADMFSYSP